MSTAGLLRNVQKFQSLTPLSLAFQDVGVLLKPKRPAISLTTNCSMSNKLYLRPRIRQMSAQTNSIKNVIVGIARGRAPREGPYVSMQPFSQITRKNSLSL